MPRRQAFVGRDGELSALLTLLAAAADEAPGVALVQGEAGAGKTRLLDEASGRLPARTLVCRGAGVGFLSGRIPYAPLVAALRSLLARLPRSEVPRVLGADPGDLDLLLPELGARGDGPADQARLIAAVGSLLDRAAELRPVVLLLDDLHCADVATLEVLAYVCAALDRQRLAVVVAFRPDEVDDVLAEWLAQVRRSPRVTEVRISPMSLAETRAHLADVLSGHPRSVLGDSLVARIHDRSGGNPYAAEALMRAALAGDKVTLPETLREVLVRRTRSCRANTAERANAAPAAAPTAPPRSGLSLSSHTNKGPHPKAAPVIVAAELVPPRSEIVIHLVVQQARRTRGASASSNARTRPRSRVTSRVATSGGPRSGHVARAACPAAATAAFGRLPRPHRPHRGLLRLVELNAFHHDLGQSQQPSP